MIQIVAAVVDNVVDVVLVLFSDIGLFIWVVVDDVDVCGHCFFVIDDCLGFGFRVSDSLLPYLGIKFISIFYSSR